MYTLSDSNYKALALLVDYCEGVQSTSNKVINLKRRAKLALKKAKKI